MALTRNNVNVRNIIRNKHSYFPCVILADCEMKVKFKPQNAFIHLSRGCFDLVICFKALFCRNGNLHLVIRKKDYN